GMNRNTFTASDVANDRFSPNRIATLGTIDHQVIDTLDPNYEVACIALLRGRKLLLLRFRRLRRLFMNLFWGELLQHLARGEFSVAKSGVQILDLAIAVFAGDALHVSFGY